VDGEDFVQNEGDIGVHIKKPYGINRLALCPQKTECVNLTVPVCLSATHTSFGSIRMEPVFMILGQSAAAATVLALDKRLPVQDVSYASLKKILLDEGQILETPSVDN
jgi:hypothetical protein